MEEWMERWPMYCTQLNYPDDDGNTLYIHTQPLPEGNMTLTIFADEQCTIESDTVDLSGYIVRSYYAYYGDNEKGLEVAATYEAAILAWNEKMSHFKTCQPCVAYNIGSSSERRKRNRRKLGDDENDGEGEEQAYYNCYDDAGYTNGTCIDCIVCNQKIRFAMHCRRFILRNHTLLFLVQSTNATNLRQKRPWKLPIKAI